MIVWIIGGVLVLDALFIWSLCRTAALADEALERRRRP